MISLFSIVRVCVCVCVRKGPGKNGKLRMDTTPAPLHYLRANIRAKHTDKKIYRTTASAHTHTQFNKRWENKVVEEFTCASL